MTEKWRPVVGFEGFYEVSSDGRFKSLRTGQLMAQVRRGRYLAVSFKAAPRKALRSAHAVVAEAFIGPRPGSLQIGHLNGDPRDNRAANLKYVTMHENEQHKRMHGTSRAALNYEQVEIILRLVSSGVSSTDLAILLDVSDNVICKAIRRHNYLGEGESPTRRDAPEPPPQPKNTTRQTGGENA